VSTVHTSGLGERCVHREQKGYSIPAPALLFCFRDRGGKQKRPPLTAAPEHHPKPSIHSPAHLSATFTPIAHERRRSIRPTKRQCGRSFMKAPLNNDPDVGGWWWRLTNTTLVFQCSLRAVGVGSCGCLRLCPVIDLSFTCCRRRGGTSPTAISMRNIYVCFIKCGTF